MTDDRQRSLSFALHGLQISLDEIRKTLAAHDLHVVTSADLAALQALTAARFFENSAGRVVFEDTGSENSVGRAELYRRRARLLAGEPRETLTEPSAMKIGDLAFYMCDGKVHSAPIVSVMSVRNAHDGWAHTNEQKATWQRFGPPVTLYATIHGTFDASKCFPTKEALLASL